MAIDSTNPLYDAKLLDWVQMRDTYEGERQIKFKGTLYLPMTSGMEEDGGKTGIANTKGTKDYDAYKVRAVYPESLSEAVEALLGVMHRKPASIELPESMEFLREDATVRNESLQMMLRRINGEQLILGRLGIMADISDSGERKDQPYLAIYNGEDPINWDDGRVDGIEIQNLNLVVIDETEDERNSDFEWERQKKFRVLLLTKGKSEEDADDAVNPEGEGSDEPIDNIPEGQGVYQTGVFRCDTDGDLGFDAAKMVAPSIRGKTLGEIPFVFINAKDIVPSPDKPPLLGLSNLTLAIYRGEADYRQGLFMQGQDTLVVIGQTEDDDEQIRTGAGATIRLTSSEHADAKYIGVESEGLVEQREALENDYERAGAKGAQLLDSVSGSQQSGDALRIRVAAKTATLNQIALAGAFGLQTLLRIVAEWMGADPKEVIVTPNLDFADAKMTGKEVLDLMAARQLGAPISLDSIHANMEEQGLTELSFEDEMKQIEAEEDMGFGVEQGSTDDTGPEPDDDLGGEDDDDDDDAGE